MDINFNELFKGTILQAANRKKMLWILGSGAFSVILLIVLLEVAFGEFLFYKYAFLAEKQEPKISNNSFQFKKDVYQNILIERQKRDKKFQDYSQKDYLSPF